MSNQEHDQRIINVRERPLSDDQNGQASQEARTLRGLLAALTGGRTNGATPFVNDGSTPRSGFIGNGFKVVPQSPVAMGINITNGYGFQYTLTDSVTDIGSVNGLNDLGTSKPLYLSANEGITVPTADPTDPRIDIVEVKYDRHLADLLSRDILDTGTGAFVATNVQKTLAWVQDGRTSVDSLPALACINYKTGTPDPAPVAPSVTAGYMKIAEVLVEAASLTVPQNKIKDTRLMLSPNHGVLEMAARATFIGTATGAAPATVQAFAAPPGCGMALHVIPASAGAAYGWYFWCGADVQDAVLMQYGEHGGATVCDIAPAQLTLTSVDIALMVGANGVLVGPEPAVGQRVLYGTTKVYQKATPGTLQTGDTVVNLLLKFRSY